MQVDCDFPGGNISEVRIEGDNVGLRQDLRDTEGWWFYWYFRVSGAGGRTVTFKFTDGEPVGVLGPAVSMDEGLTWNWLGKGRATKSSFEFTFPQKANSVRFSMGMPYTESNFTKFFVGLGDRADVKLAKLCDSRKGRPVELLRIGRLDGNAGWCAVIACRHHACEMMASYELEGVVESVLAEDETGRWLRGNMEFFIVPFVDKDGVEDGDQGKNRRPHDHNRDYIKDAVYPETRTIAQSFVAWRAGRRCVALDLHCPGIRGQWHEHVYQVGKANPEMWEQQLLFGKLLQSSMRGALPYDAARNLAFMQDWNTNRDVMSFGRWAAAVQKVDLATSIELPYANAEGVEVNAASARQFGSDLARALYLYADQFKPRHEMSSAAR